MWLVDIDLEKQLLTEAKLMEILIISGRLVQHFGEYVVALLQRVR